MQKKNLKGIHDENESGKLYCTLWKVHLYSENSKNDEKCTADEDNVPDGFQRRKECLNDEFKSWCAIDNS